MVRLSKIADSETSKGTILHTLEKKWKASYDIVVRPHGTEAATEEDGLMDPNYLSGLSGGITSDELHTIKEIEGVSIAAPISILGYTMINTYMGEFEFSDGGIYRLRNHLTEYDGITEYVRDINTYYGVDLNLDINSFEASDKYNLFTENQFGKITKGDKIDLYGNFTMLIAAIDPEAEEQLVGLEQATLIAENSNYFKEEEDIYTTSNDDLGFQVTQ